MPGRCYPTRLRHRAPRGGSDNRRMHLLVPFASDRSEACRHVLRDLALPNLERLLALLAPAGRDDGDAGSFSPPHERALAAAWGWHGGDGLLPFAAHAAAGDGIATGDAGLGAADAGALAARPRRRDDARSRPCSTSPRPSRARCSRAPASCSTSEGFAIAWGARRPLVRGARRPAGARDRVARSRHRPQRRPLAARVGRRRRRRRAPSRAAAAPAERSAARLPQPRRQRSARRARRARGELVLAERLRPAPAGRCGGDARDRRRACARRCSPTTGRRGPRPGARSTRRRSRACSRTRARGERDDADALRRAQRGALRAAAALALAAPARRRREDAAHDVLAEL